jgi:D-alanyl-D-alanine carboxypeptidase
MNKLQSATLIVFSLALLSCPGATPNQELQSNLPVFDLDLFEQNLIDRVTWLDAPVGWAYTISVNGVLERAETFGDARTDDDGQMDFGLNQEINVASVTKFYTAIAALQLLKANGLDENDLIHPYLPGTWRLGPGVTSLSFEDLLRHRSGLESENRNFSTTLSYSGLQTAIETGVVNPKSRAYLNVNFALFRILIPSLWSQLPGAPAININSDGNTEYMYQYYMQKHIFDPLGLPLVNMSATDATDILYYAADDPFNDVNGIAYDDWGAIGAGGGYFMTILEMAKLNAYFLNTEVLLDEVWRQKIYDMRLGLDLSSAYEERGPYYGKAGQITNGVDQGVMTQVAFFPYNNVDVTVVMNTGDVMLFDGNVFDEWQTLRDVIYLAYNEAWE